MTRAPLAEREKNALSEDISDFKSFRRAMHAKGEVEKGLGSARTKLNPKTTALVVTQAMRLTVYRNAMVRNPFPETIQKIKKGRALPKAADAVEALWAAGVLSY